MQSPHIQKPSEWFPEARFGMFVHWGLYSVAARHEWVMNYERIPVETYEKYAQRFDPDLFNPSAWAASAVAAGMKYAVLTAKHHDGFCLWDSKLTDYTSMNSPAGRDLIREYVDAIRAAGLRVGFYYSLLDWHHPDFTIDGHHPRRDDPDAAELNKSRDMARYRAYLKGQVRELLSQYGTIDYLFFDFSYQDRPGEEIWGGKGPGDWGSDDVMRLVRELQPGIVVNDRLGIDGDLITPEQYQPTEPMRLDGELVRWEACQTLNGSWGYFRDNHDYKSPDLLLRMLIDGVSKDGNLLLNVGPTARGEFEAEAVQSLAVIGEWMRVHSRSIYGAGSSAYTPPTDTRYTQRGNRLYLHLFAWPFEYVHLPALAGKVEFAQLLNDGSEIRMREFRPDAVAFNTEMGAQPAGTLSLSLPISRPNVAVPVVELFLAP